MPQSSDQLTPPFEVRAGDRGVGAEIFGLNLAEPISDAVFDQIASVFGRYSVVAFRGQSLSPEQRIAFSRRFGPLQINVRSEFNKAGYPEIYTVSNILKDGKPIGSQDAGRYWHSDLCYLPVPTLASLLYAIEVPKENGVARGDTLFASTCEAYAGLPDEVKKRLEGLRAVNSYSAMFQRKAAAFGVRPTLTDQDKVEKYPKDAIHPVIRTHPATGRKCIYVCEGYTTRILDIPEDESDALLRILFDQVVKPEYIYRHKWQVGDLTMWDNCALQHKASFDYALPLRRHMERTTVEGSIPF
jgi:taurine dioxygenase